MSNVDACLKTNLTEKLSSAPFYIHSYSDQVFIEYFAGETPDENDLFPSTPLDEEQLRHYNAQEELGSVVINQVEEQEVRAETCPYITIGLKV